MSRHKLILVGLVLTLVLLASSSAVANPKLAYPKSAHATYGPAEYEELVKAQILDAASPTDGIQPGTGYSHDTLAIAPVACYAPLTVTRSGQSSTVNFSLRQDVSQIADSFGVTANFSGAVGIFGADGLIRYLNELKENNYSIGLNYSEEISDSVNSSYSYVTDTILNDTGKAIYANGQNPLFRLFCGDTLITGYDEGAGLIMSMKISFSDKSQKEIFASHIGAGITSFLNAAGDASSIAAQYHLTGQISILAYQLGGDPSQLAKMLGSSVVTCSLASVDDCKLTAKDLIDYATNIFPTQIVQQNGVWLSSLAPIGAIKTDFQVSDFGMLLAPNYATPDVLAARSSLADKFNHNKYYADNLYSILNSYKVPLDPSYQAQVTGLNNTVQKNLKLFSATPNGSSALDCWKFPYKCVDNANYLLGLLQGIESGSVFNTIIGPILHNYYEHYLGTTLWVNGSLAGPLAVFPDFPDNGHWHMTSAAMQLIPTPEGSSWEIDGTYYDAGRCPGDGNTFTLKPKFSIGYSPAILTMNYFGYGSCPSGTNTYEIQMDLLDNPYAFNPI